MAQHTTVGLGICALAAGALGVLAPQAAAQDLAPGVSCNDQGSCRNDTDDIYYVTGNAVCSGFPASNVPVGGYVDRHSSAAIPMSCPSMDMSGPMDTGPMSTGPDGSMQPWSTVQIPDTPTSNQVLTVQWQTATVDNDHKLAPPTGSS